MSDDNFVLKPGFVMYSTEGLKRKRATCRFCGRALNPHQSVSSGICGGPECHAKMIEEVGTALLKRRRREHEARMQGIVEAAGKSVEAALDEIGSPREKASIAVLPWQGRPVEPLGDARRAAFRAHLEEMADLAFGGKAGLPEGEDPETRDKNENPEPDVVVGACSTCRGHCCARGGDTALLLPFDLARHAERNPGLSREAVIEAYLSYLPAASTRGGCVYQAAAGCSLPRAMRQDICNSYYCESLRWLNRDYLEKRTGNVVFVAADDEDHPRSVAAFDLASGCRHVADLPAPDSADETP